jgi:hypothetical protein
MVEKKHSEHSDASGMRQSKLLSEWSSGILFRDTLAFDKKQCRLVPRMLAGHCS